MSGPIIGALALGFVFGWLGRWTLGVRIASSAYARGFDAGMGEMSRIANARCSRCVASGVPTPTEIKVESANVP